MNLVDKYCVYGTQTIKDVISAIQSNATRCTIAVNENMKVIGVFSEGDVLRAILHDVDLYTPIKKILKPSFFYLNERDMEKGYNLIKAHGITLLPVVDKEFNLKDVITIFDVMDQLKYEGITGNIR